MRIDLCTMVNFKRVNFLLWLFNFQLVLVYSQEATDSIRDAGERPAVGNHQY